MLCPKIYAIIVTFNGSLWIENCLQSLGKSNCPVEILVVDNASTDTTLSLISRHEDVECLSLEKNFGFGQANNIGMRRALQGDADFIFLLNQDARVQPETISRLVNCAQQNPDFGILSPMHLNGDGSEIDYLFSRYIARATNPSFTNFLSDCYFRQSGHVYPISFVNAAAWLISRPCLEQVGGFDPLFFMYGEDDDFCNRVRFHGYQIGLMPEAVIFHSREKNATSQPNLLTRLKRGSNRRASEMLPRLKQPSGSFIRNIKAWSSDTLCQGLRFLFNGEFKELASLTVALGKIMMLLPKILKHRKISQRSGPNWI